MQTHRMARARSWAVQQQHGKAYIVYQSMRRSIVQRVRCIADAAPDAVMAESAAAAAAAATAFAASIFVRLVLSLRRGAAMAFRARCVHAQHTQPIDR